MGARAQAGADQRINLLSGHVVYINRGLAGLGQREGDRRGRVERVRAVLRDGKGSRSGIGNTTGWLLMIPLMESWPT